MKNALLFIMLVAMIPALSKWDTCKIVGENFEGVGSVVFYNEAQNRMDTCRVTDGHFGLSCKRSSSLFVVSPDASYYLGLAERDTEIMGYPRSFGLSIRPVCR